MICVKCGANLPSGRTTCINCGEEVPVYNSGFDSGSDNLDIGSGSRSGGFLNSKGGAITLGVLEIFIGAFICTYLFFEFSAIGVSIAILGTIFYSLLAVLLPLIGVILIGTNSYKAGGIILIIGSIFCFPIGLIGMYGGKTAMDLYKYS